MNRDDIVICAKDVSKRYRISHEVAHETVRDAVGHGIRSVWARLRRQRNMTSSEEFWALRDVNFEVKRGEIAGIIGRNGAGKSTLLKILSRIIEPTRGRIELRGRVASLLEVGTGFHPELTGRDNVFLNGAILGMSRAEISRKFDEIVAFAEVDKFIDTPVKRYSSGMYVRLAFAVAAHLEPEILIVDEVLAVGDAQFQQKCLGRMEQVAHGEGRTVLFVSHNLAAVRQLCRTALLLSSGNLIGSGPVGKVLDLYQSSLPVQATFMRTNSTFDLEAVITEVALRDAHHHVLDRFNSGDPIFITIRLDVRQALPPVQLAVRVSTFEGVPVLTTTNVDAAGVLAALPAGRHDFRVQLPAWLSPGLYALKVALCQPQRRVFDAVDDEIRFEITSTNSFAAALLDDRKGVAMPLLDWNHHHLA